MKVFQSINPFDQAAIAEHEIFSEKKMDHTLQNASAAFEHWKNTSFAMRSNLLKNVANILRSNKQRYAKLISLEMGKMIFEAEGEIEKCAWNCDYFAEHGEQYLKDETISTDAKKSFIAFEPLGAVFAIMPWNFPFWQVFRFAAPTLMSGNVILLKHARNVSGCALEIEKIFQQAAFPKNVFQTIIVDFANIEKIIAQDIVQAVTLTGSESAGSSVASIAGKHIKKTVLELGGSDAFIVLEDADLNHAAEIAVKSRMQNAGQSCIAAKRFIVVERIKDVFIDLFIQQIKNIRQGNQLDRDNSMGPMAKADLAETLENQCLNSLKKGAHTVIKVERNGCNFKPALLADVSPGMPAFDEEVFGPVAAIVTAKDENDAIRLANNHRYGLGASLFTADLEKADKLARKISSGNVFINSLMKSDPRLPFGGIKKSGYGRELSEFGIREFTNIKTIFIQE